MRSPFFHSRRHFIQTAALAASALPFAGFPLVTAAKANGKPKVGCLSWCFHDLSPGADPEPAISIIGELGFDGIELIVNAAKDLETFWTNARVDRLKQKLDEAKLQVSQFVLFQPVVEGLSSTKRGERDRALDHFEAGCRLAEKFEAPIVNIVAPWSRELTGPGSYLPRYYEIGSPKEGEKFHIDIADGFDWERVWKGYVETTKACLERAKAHRIRFSIEHHTHTLIPEAASFLRLWDQIGDPALGYNLDTGWTLLQREYPPVAIHKVAEHLMNVHMRDIDGTMRRFVHIGEGVMDFKSVVEALRQVGYNGFVSLEQDKHPGDMKETCRRYRHLMREHIG